MRTKSSSYRLPGYDRQTGRWELLVFASLGLAGFWLVGSACRHAGDFAVERDTIAATLSGETTIAAHRNPTNHALTNLTCIPANERVEQPGQRLPTHSS